MGFTPSEVDGMDLLEFRAAADAFRRFHAPPDEEDEAVPPTADEFRAMVERHADMRRPAVGR